MVTMQCPTSTTWTSLKAALSIWLCVVEILRPSVSALPLGPKSTSNKYETDKYHKHVNGGLQTLTLSLNAKTIHHNTDVHLLSTKLFSYHLG